MPLPCLTSLPVAGDLRGQRGVGRAVGGEGVGVRARSRRRCRQRPHRLAGPSIRDMSKVPPFTVSAPPAGSEPPTASSTSVPALTIVPPAIGPGRLQSAVRRRLGEPATPQMAPETVTLLPLESIVPPPASSVIGLVNDSVPVACSMPPLKVSEAAAEARDVGNRQRALGDRPRRRLAGRAGQRPCPRSGLFEEAEVLELRRRPDQAGVEARVHGSAQSQRIGCAEGSHVADDRRAGSVSPAR